MSSVIDFLEKMGQDAQLRYVPLGELELVLARTEIDSALQAAILAQDQPRLEALLDSVNICCMIEPGKEEEEEEEEEEDAEESSPRNDEEALALSAFSVMTSAD